MHSLTQLLPQLWRKTLDTGAVTGAITIMDITTVMAMPTMGITLGFTPVAWATVMVTTLVATMEIMTSTTTGKGKVI